MMLRQLFDDSSCTYTYLIADAHSRQCALIDPVLEQLASYQQLLSDWQLTLSYAIDTHVHADHITALSALRKIYGCDTVHGAQSKAQGVTHHVHDGDQLHLGAIKLQAIYTPGHTDDSYCFLLKQKTPILFSGDTLLIGGTGRTDFQGGCAEQQYQSIFDRLLTLPDDTVLYPGHDYNGKKMSSIGAERQHNPRLQVNSSEEYRRIMERLNLDRPKLMDVALPANLLCGIRS